MAQPTERYDVCAGRPYTTRDGEEKKQWINVGRATKWDDGGISIELHAVPVGQWFDGKLNLFAQKEREQQQGKPPRQESKPREPSFADGPAQSFTDDEIPFSPIPLRQLW